MAPKKTAAEMAAELSAKYRKKSGGKTVEGRPLSTGSTASMGQPSKPKKRNGMMPPKKGR